MGFRLLAADSAFWRRSTQMGVLNTDLGRQLETSGLGARFWRLEPGQASTKHRHAAQEELYVLLEGTGQIRVDDHDPLTLKRHDALVIEPRSVRQVFNDTSEDALWLVVGAPLEQANTLEMSAEQLRDLYPDGPKALPPELAED
jgi:uncharacterized cupin superfamily protein